MNEKMDTRDYMIPLVSEVDIGFNIPVSPRLVSHFGERNRFDGLIAPERISGAVLVSDGSVQRAVFSEFKGSNLVFYIAPDLLSYTLLNNGGEFYVPEFLDRMRSRGYEIRNLCGRKFGSTYKALLDVDRRKVIGRFPGNLPGRSRVKLDLLRRHHEWNVERSSKHHLSI